MRPIDSIKINHLKDPSLNDLRQDKDQKQNHIDAIKNKISSIGVEREDCDCSHNKDRSSDFFDIFRRVKKGFMNIINIFHQAGDIDKDDYKEKKSISIILTHIFKNEFIFFRIATELGGLLVPHVNVAAM